jgi:hypothetical protein
MFMAGLHPNFQQRSLSRPQRDVSITPKNADWALGNHL